MLSKRLKLYLIFFSQTSKQITRTVNFLKKSDVINFRENQKSHNFERKTFKIMLGHGFIFKQH